MLQTNDDLITSVFGTEVRVISGVVNADGMIPVSAVLPSRSAFSRFISYDTHTDIAIVNDQDEFHRLLVECRGRRSLAFSALRILLAVPVYLINVVSGIVRSILGSFMGFGLIGILIVVAAIAISLFVGLYAFIIAAPFIIAGAALNFYERRVYKNAGAQFLKTVKDHLSDEYPPATSKFLAEAFPDLMPASDSR